MVALVAMLVPGHANQAGGFVTTVTTPVTSGYSSYAGQSCVFMDNGIIHAIINPQGFPLSIRFLKPGSPGTPLQDGVEMVGQGPSSGNLYGGNYNIFYSAPNHDFAFPVANISYATPPTAQQVDYAFTAIYGPAYNEKPWDTIIHWVLRQGDTGLYTYLVLNHPASYGAASTTGITLLWGSAHDSKNFLLEDTFVDNMGTGLLDNRGLPESRRHGLSVSFEDVENTVSTSMDNDQVVNTDPLSKFYGYIDTKYCYIADLNLLDCWGRASDINHLGGWFVQGSHEFSPSGPEFNDFTQGWGLVYDCLTTLHGIQTNYTIPAGTAYRKVYGPTMIYLNALSTGAANWADAQQQALAEKAAWPYSWLTYEPGYQTAAQRATVTGTISIVDQTNANVSGNGAWVGLAETDSGQIAQNPQYPSFYDEVGDYKHEAIHHQYWVQAAANGSFSFPNVATTDCYGKPETYSLYAYSNGVSGSNGAVGEYMGPNFSLTAGQNKSLGTVTWNVPHKGTSILWQIGNPDRIGQEFGGFQTSMQPQNFKYRNYGYLNLFAPLGGNADLSYLYPNPLEYNTATGNASQLSWAQTDDSGAWLWDLNFNLSGAPTSGNYWLTIAYAGNGFSGGSSGHQNIFVNGTPLYFDITASEQAGLTPPNSAEFNEAHNASHYAYGVVHVPISSSWLHSGSNTVTLSCGGGMFYDYIDMETPTLVDDGIYTLSIEQNGSNVYTLGVASTTATNTQVYTYPGAGATLNQWQVINLGGSHNSCEFINVASGLALTGGSSGVTQAALVGSANQIWQVQPGSAGGYLLLCTGQSSNAANGGTIAQPYTSGSNSVVLSTASGGAAGQNWVFTLAPPIVSCPSTITTNVNTPLSVWVTTGVDNSNFAPAADFTSSGFNWFPQGSPLAPTYSATNLPPGMTINSFTGLISGTTSTSGTYSATIMATSLGVTGSLPVTVNVGVALSGLSFPGSTSLTWGVPYSGQVTGTSGDVTGFSATGLPPGLTINASTGLISGTPTVYADNNPSQSYGSTIYVTNPGGTRSINVSFSVGPPVPAITSPLTATGIVGSSFSYTATATYTPIFSATGYPAGLSFNTGNGVLSGTPTTAGTYNVLLSAANPAGGYCPPSTLVLTVYAAPTSAPVINSASTASGTAGAAFSYAITATNLPTSFSASGLPAGLSVDTTSGQISGAATGTGVSTVTLGATNKLGTGTKTLTLTIGTPAAPVIASSGTVPAEALAPFSYSVSASHNPTSYNASGLPSGLSINTTTGVISGTPSASGNTVVSLSATNQGGTGTGSITLAASAASKPVINSASTDTESLGVAVNFQLTAANGPTNFTAGTLPLGLSLNASTGLISGAPGVAGTFSIPITASNSVGTATGTLTMTVNPAAWTSVDVGVPGWFGDNTTYSNGAYFMVAAGTGYGGTADSFQFSYQQLSGDGAIIARVTGFSNPNFQVGPGSQGGVMIRSSLQPNAPFYAASVGYSGSTVAQYRTSAGANSTTVGVNGFSAPYWVKVVRAGNVFTGYGSLDGTNWAQIGSPQTIVMPNTVYMGLAGNEGSTLLSTYTTFDNVNLVAGSPLWASSDIGAVSASGNTSYSGGVYSLVASGTDIWNNSDQFHYACLPVTSDCSMIARVTSVANAGPNSKAGIMMRDALTPSAANIIIFGTPGVGVNSDWRTTDGGNTAQAARYLSTAPYWIKLIRAGNVFTTYYSTDGINWTQQTSQTVSMPSTIYVGLALSAVNSTTALCTATFDNISLSAPNNPAPPVIANGITIPGTVGSALNYSLSATNSPFSFASATLPGGVVITPAGLVTGSPTGTGTRTASITAENSGGLGTNTVTFSFVAAAPVIVPSATPVAATVNKSFSYGISVQNGASSYTASGVPPGLTFNTSNGTYSGTPTTSGTYTVSETATNSTGTDSATQSFVFSPAPPDITSSLDPTGTALSSFNYTVTADNSPTTFDAINLPLGLSINMSTGVISGTPLASGTFSFYVTATNQYGTASVPLSLVLSIPVPEAPTNLAATPWDSQIDLLWDAPYAATTYNVFRATSASGPYSVVASNLTATYYSDRTVADGTTYYYEVNASNTTGTGPNSGYVMATPVPMGANAWEAGDIGSVGVTGSTSYSAGTYTVAGSGTDIWGSADAFQFNCQEMTGDGAIVARVASIQNVSPSSKAGLMMREALTPGAANASILGTPSYGVNSEWRTTNGGSTSQGVNTASTAPYWIKLVRAANVFTSFYSTDGVSWTQQASNTISMPSTIYVGLAVSAVNNTALCTATFDNVNILPSAAWSAADIGSPSVAGLTSWSNGVLTVNASGSDVWNASDQFRYVYQPASGDCSITAEITAVEATTTQSKGGVMIRETLASNSDHVVIFGSPYGGASFQQRATAGGGSGTIANSTPVLIPPYWVRITRSGNVFTAFTSQDGSSWLAFGSTTVNMGTNVYVGIPFTSHNGSALGTATFSNISVSP